MGGQEALVILKPGGDTATGNDFAFDSAAFYAAIRADMFVAEGFLLTLKEMLKDKNPTVSANAVAALAEIEEMSGDRVFSKILGKFGAEGAGVGRSVVLAKDRTSIYKLSWFVQRRMKHASADS